MVSRLPRGRFRHGPHCRRSSSPCPSALAAFAIALAVVATTFLAIDAGLIFDCCVPLPPEEDHCLPPTLGKVRSWPSSPSFVDCRRRRNTTSPLPRRSFASAASWSPSVLLLAFPPLIQRNRITGNVFFIYGITFMVTGPDSQIWRVQIWNKNHSQKKELQQAPSLKHGHCHGHGIMLIPCLLLMAIR